MLVGGSRHRLSPSHSSFLCALGVDRFGQDEAEQRYGHDHLNWTMFLPLKTTYQPIHRESAPACRKSGKAHRRLRGWRFSLSGRQAAGRITPPGPVRQGREARSHRVHQFAPQERPSCSDQETQSSDQAAGLHRQSSRSTKRRPAMLPFHGVQSFTGGSAVPTGVLSEGE